MAGVAREEQSRILMNFPFAVGSLPVRYLGLPLMTKVMRKQDYLPLMEKIRNRIGTWTTRFLSYAGRLQLIKVVLRSIASFWASVFRLPSQCMKEVEQMCASFLWSGPNLKATGAKVAWSEVCKLEEEGGLGIRPLKEVNMVYGLKIIWRLLSGESLWGRWIKCYLLKKRSFWAISGKTQMGSWMWKKILKLREVAKRFFMKEIGNGKQVSFWFDNWSCKGVMFDLLGDRGIIDLGIRREATVEEAILSNRRSRNHRVEFLNSVEEEIKGLKDQWSVDIEDVNLWKCRAGYKNSFQTKETWLMIRVDYEKCDWAKGVWFSMSTPKFAFITWLAMRDRLSTMDRVSLWNQGVDTMCVLCKMATECRNHLFFECVYSAQIWDYLLLGIMGSSHSTVWSDVVF